VNTTVEAEVRAEIGRRLREYFRVCSTIPDRLAHLLKKIGQLEPRSEEVRIGRSPMAQRDEYLANAEECERLAEMASNAGERTSWLQMAQQWHRWARRR
jgi:hypothetical protein